MLPYNRIQEHNQYNFELNQLEKMIAEEEITLTDNLHELRNLATKEMRNAFNKYGDLRAASMVSEYFIKRQIYYERLKIDEYNLELTKMTGLYDLIEDGNKNYDPDLFKTIKTYACQRALLDLQERIKINNLPLNSVNGDI